MMYTHCLPRANTPTVVEYRPYVYAPAPEQASMPYLVCWDAMANRNEAIAQTEKWQLESLKSIASLGKLPADWDGYGSHPPTDAVRAWANELVLRTDLASLLPPSFFPESDGALQINWHSGLNRTIELHVIPNGQVEYLKLQSARPPQEGAFSLGDAGAVDRLLVWLKRG